jgi:hypothetical protein
VVGGVHAVVVVCTVVEVCGRAVVVAWAVVVVVWPDGSVVELPLGVVVDVDVDVEGTVTG